MADKPQINWDSIADKTSAYSKTLVDEISARTKENADRAQHGNYGLDQAIADIGFFWDRWAEGVMFALNTFNDEVVKRGGS